MKSNLIKVLIFLTVICVLGFLVYKYKTSTYITAEFVDLRPFHTKAPIFYNGFEIGKVVKVRPNDNYSATIVTMRLHPRHLRLPINIAVHLKKEKNKKNDKYDFIDIIYPQTPSPYFLKNGDRVAGKTTVELESYLSNQDPESLNAIKADFAETIKNLNITVQTLGDLFETLNTIASDSKPNILQTTSELETSSKNLTRILSNVNSLTGNIDQSITAPRLNYTTENIQKLSDNLNLLTEGINSTLPQIQCAINGTNRILCNVEEMTGGINKTLKKPFGGFRLFFGRPISK